MVDSKEYWTQSQWLEIANYSGVPHVGVGTWVTCFLRYTYNINDIVEVIQCKLGIYLLMTLRSS